jgi:hypothetical protein
MGLSLPSLRPHHSPIDQHPGANPATIDVGDTYEDLGAIATDNQGHDLSYKTFLDGTLVSNIVIDNRVDGLDGNRLVRQLFAISSVADKSQR